jgi:hypothetical protein
VLDVALLTLFAGIFYGAATLLPVFFEVSPEELRQVENEFYTARASLVPPTVDVRKEVEALYERLEKNDQLDTVYPNYGRAEIISLLTSQKQLEKRAASVGETLMWEFRNVRPLDPSQSLFIRFKYDVSVTPPDEQAYGDWLIGDLRQNESGPTGRRRSTAPRKTQPASFTRSKCPPPGRDGYWPSPS